MSMGKRQRQQQGVLFAATSDLPQQGGHPFDQRANEVLDSERARLVKGKKVGIDATTLEANATIKSIVRRHGRELRCISHEAGAGFGDRHTDACKTGQDRQTPQTPQTQGQ